MIFCTQAKWYIARDANRKRQYEILSEGEDDAVGEMSDEDFKEKFSEKCLKAQCIEDLDDSALVP